MNDLIAVEKIAQWQKLKTLVLDSVSSPITKRVYNMALEEFMAWFQQAPRPGFTKATVSAWRVSLEDRRLGSSCIIIRMSAIRKLAAEAADNGMLAPELAAGIAGLPLCSGKPAFVKPQGLTGRSISEAVLQRNLDHTHRLSCRNHPECGGGIDVGSRRKPIRVVRKVVGLKSKLQ